MQLKLLREDEDKDEIGNKMNTKSSKCTSNERPDTFTAGSISYFLLFSTTQEVGYDIVVCT